MLNSSLLKILRTFTPDEHKDFSEFINSPFHNKKSGAVLLYEKILKYAPEFGNNDLERKLFWKLLYPGKDFNYGIMKNLIYDLTRLSEKFIVQKRHDADVFLNSYELISALYERDLKDLFISKFNSLNKTALKDSFERNAVREDFYYYMWRSYGTKWNFDNSLIHSKEYKSIIDFSSDYFMASFLIHSFIIYHNIEAQRFEHNYTGQNVSVIVFLGNAHNSGLIQEIIRSVGLVSSDTALVLEVYYKMFISVRQNDSSENYFEFKKSLEKNKKLFSGRDLLALNITLLNCLTYLEPKDIFKQKESLDIYDSMIESKIFFSDNGRVWDQDFLNYITSAANLGIQSSIENFINKVLNRLQTDAKENMLLFANAYLFFVKGDFGRSLEYIAKTDYGLFQMKFYLRNLQIKIFYELNDYDSFELAKDSYNHFLDKNRSVSRRWKTAMKSFCDIISRMFRLKNNFDEFEYNILRNEIISINGDRNIWIVNKINELRQENMTAKK